MKSSNELRTQLRAIDKKSYPAYKSLAGSFQFPKFALFIDHVQGDPFASPSSLHVEIALKDAGFPAAYCEKDCTRIALQDFLTRAFSKEFEQYNFKAKGSGKSGLLSISRCSQKVLERTACQITEQTLIVRFFAGFPAFGRTIQARELEKILFDFLPHCVESALFFEHTDKHKLQQAIFLAEDQEALRLLLRKEKLAAFVANNSILPRKSGVCELPLKDAVPFHSPSSMERTFMLPHHGAVSGMAIPIGITLIVGGGYHGKSTLLSAIQEGVFNHIVGDGREFVIADDTAVKLRAEDGRSVRNVDISLFINHLPNGKNTTSFSTADASGSTSQAAGVIESIESGSRLFLVDEDTSATNFMVRDEFMQQVIESEKEPITPFIERTRDLYEKAGISTIMVAGSSGAFFHIADNIILMDCYHAVDITKKVKDLCKNYTAPRRSAKDFAIPSFDRVLPKYRQNGGKKYEHMKIKTHGVDSFSLDKETIDVRYLEQLTDAEQTAALAYLLRFCLEQVQDGQRTVQQTVQMIKDILDKKGFAAFCGSYVPCGLAMPRIQELYACINRFRG